ncbi:hypothetical protein HYV72_00725 [Candidatus Uhrbacteria bacterium]|nr:hypothetical protein [Candidatus Uhrbacteria bacterium]
MGDITLTLEGFVERLLMEKGVLGSMEQEVEDELKADLVARVEDRVNAEMLAALPKEQATELEKLLEKSGSSGEDVHLFLREHIPAFDEVLANALMSFRNTYLNLG